MEQKWYCVLWHDYISESVHPYLYCTLHFKDLAALLDIQYRTCVGPIERLQLCTYFNPQPLSWSTRLLCFDIIYTWGHFHGQVPSLNWMQPQLKHQILLCCLDIPSHADATDASSKWAYLYTNKNKPVHIHRYICASAGKCGSTVLVQVHTYTQHYTHDHTQKLA